MVVRAILSLILFLKSSSGFIQLNPGIAIKTSIPLPHLPDLHKISDSGYQHEESFRAPETYETPHKSPETYITPQIYNPSQSLFENKFQFIPGVKTDTTPSPLFYGDTQRPKVYLKNTSPLPTYITTIEQIGEETGLQGPYKVHVHPEPGQPQPLHVDQDQDPSYPQHYDQDDPYEPMAENEADFQPSIFPLLLQGNTIDQAETSRVSSDLELVQEYKKLEIEDGYQHISPGTKEPSLTFQSPMAINSSTSIQVRDSDPIQQLHQELSLAPPFPYSVYKQIPLPEPEPSPVKVYEREVDNFVPSFLESTAVRENSVFKDSVRLDMVDAYKTYKQQWTSSGEKKLVKDASKALKEYQTRVNPDITDSTVNSHIGESQTYDYKAPDFHTDEYGRPENDHEGEKPLHPMSLMYLGPKGPEAPFFGTMMSDLHGMMMRGVRNTQNMFKEMDLHNSGSNMMHSIAYTAEDIMYKMTSQYGDGKLDIYDWIPLLAIIFLGVFVFGSLFPTAAIGRSARRDEDIIESTISQLENGILILSAIKDGGTCSEKLACSLGSATRSSFKSPQSILDVVDLLVPNKYANFTRTFEKTVNSKENLTCKSECRRCVNF